MGLLSSSKIIVAVRCRPLNAREKKRNAPCLVEMRGKETYLINPAARPAPSLVRAPLPASSLSVPARRRPRAQSESVPSRRAFTFDYSYWSGSDTCDDSAPDPAVSDNRATQQVIFNDIGMKFLDHALDGYNTCIFAYGQTGSGKSYTMIGSKAEPGIVPMTCQELFRRIQSLAGEHTWFNVEISYMEIYNERVRDLLNPKNNGTLRVREHPLFGPYVEDLSKVVVNSWPEIQQHLDQGNKTRTVASTNMNKASSRSHAVFTIVLTQTFQDPATQLEAEKVSRISLVDLAGSERVSKTGVTGRRLKEGGSINRSLTTLGKVISALSAQTTTKREVFVPYRDSVLTWLLKESLGGNSRTAMIATISPTEYDESLSTLRYAERAKNIVNEAVVNEDPNAKLIRELQQELAELREKLAQAQGVSAQKSSQPDTALVAQNDTAADPGSDGAEADGPTAAAEPGGDQQHGGQGAEVEPEELQRRITESEKLMHAVNKTWEEKRKETQEIQQVRESALKEMGIAVATNDAGDEVGVHIPKSAPHLVNLCEDALMSECLIYNLKPGITTVGRVGSSINCDIKLSASDIQDRHCWFERSDKDESVTVNPSGNVFVNGRLIRGPQQLHSGYRVVIGSYHVFRFNNPLEARRQKQAEAAGLELPGGGRGVLPQIEVTDSDSVSRPTSPMNDADTASMVGSYAPDFYHAVREIWQHNQDWQQGSPSVSEASYPQHQHPQQQQPQSFYYARSMPPSPIAIQGMVPDGANGSGGGNSWASPSLAGGSGSAFLGGSFTSDYNEALAVSSPHPNISMLLSSLSPQIAPYNSFDRPVSPIFYQTSAGIRPRPAGAHASTVRIPAHASRRRAGSMPQPPQFLTLPRSYMSPHAAAAAAVTLHARRGSTRTIGNIHSIVESFRLGTPAEEGWAAATGPSRLSDAQAGLARAVLEKWRSLRYVRLAKDILENVVHVKEANILCKALDQNIIFQLAIFEGGVDSYPASCFEPDGNPAATGSIVDDDGEPLSSSIGSKIPRVAVRVIDFRNQIVGILGLGEFRNRLDCTRRVAMYKQCPGYSPHFSSIASSLLTEHPSSRRYSLIGQCAYPIILGPRVPCTVAFSAHVFDSMTYTVTGRVAGTIRIEVPPYPPTLSADADAYRVISVQVVSAHGLPSSMFTHMHCQCIVRSDSQCAQQLENPADAPSLKSNNGYACSPLVPRGDQEEDFEIGLSHEWLVSAASRDIVLAIQLFGRATPQYMRQAFQVDMDLCPPTKSETRPLSRSSHELVMWVGMLELNYVGEWQPVPVSRSTAQSAFLIHQGLQQRVVVNIGHSNDDGLSISEISAVRVGRCQLVDVHDHPVSQPAATVAAATRQKTTSPALPHGGDASEDMNLHILSSQCDTSDTNHLHKWHVRAIAFFDTSSHQDSPLLTQPSPHGHYVRLQLEVAAVADDCHSPITLATTIHLKVYSRNASIPRVRCDPRQQHHYQARMRLSSPLSPAPPAPRHRRGNSVVSQVALETLRSTADISPQSSDVQTINVDSFAPRALSKDPDGSDNGSGSNHKQAQLASSGISIRSLFTGSSISFLPIIESLSQTSSGSHSTADKLVVEQYGYPEISHGVARMYIVNVVPNSLAGAGLGQWDTSGQYMRGEEAVAPWRPHGVNLIRAFHRWRHEQSWWMAVEKARQMVASVSLASKASLSAPPNGNDGGEAVVANATEPSQYTIDNVKEEEEYIAADDQEAAIATRQRCVGPIAMIAAEIWKERVVEALRSFKRVGQIHPLLSEGDDGDTQATMYPPTTSPPAYDQYFHYGGTPTPTSLIQSVVPVHMLHNRGAKEGYLRYSGNVVRSADSRYVWESRWVAIERPHLFVYATHQKTVLLDFLNIAPARVIERATVAAADNEETSLPPVPPATAIIAAVTTAAGEVSMQDNGLDDKNYNMDGGDTSGFVFTVVTPTKSRSFQAATQEEMHEWMHLIDAWHSLLP